MKNKKENYNNGFTRQNFLRKNSGGFIKIIVIAIVIIAALVYFKVDVRGFFENAGIQKFLAILKGAWTNFIVPLFSYLWTSISGLFN